MNRRIYLDNAATTAVDPAVLDAMMPFFALHPGNASSIHEEGRIARTAVENARQQVARLFDADPGEIVFTCGGTESINTVLRSVPSFAPAGARAIVTSRAEHHATLAACRRAADEGCPTRLLPVDASGRVPLDALERALTPDVALVALLHGNNETGALHPLERIGELCAERGIRFFADTTQTVGKTRVSARTMRFDFAASSAHKLHGPKGIGALYVRSGVKVAPFMLGGAQERTMRGGTEAVPLIVGYGEAARLALAHLEETEARWGGFRALLISLIGSAFDRVIVNGAADATLLNIASFSFPHTAYPMDGSMITVNMDIEGVAVSGGSACSSGSATPSHVMIACGHDPDTAGATVRFSFGRATTEEEVRAGARTLIEIVKRLVSTG